MEVKYIIVIIVMVLFITIKVRGWLKKKPRLYIENGKRFFRLTKNYKVRETLDINEATSFSYFSPFVRYWANLLSSSEYEDEDGWRIKRRHHIPNVKMKAGTKNTYNKK